MTIKKFSRLTAMLVSALFLLGCIVQLVRASVEYTTHLSTVINNFEQARLPKYGDEVSISGYLLSASRHKPVENKVLRLAEVYRDPNGDVFILDMAWSPGTFSGDAGYFEFLDVRPFQKGRKDPAEFVIIIQEGENTFDVIQQGNHPHNGGVWVVSLSSAISTGFIYTSMEENTWLNGMTMEIK